jgi:Xaa-Pro aminopeptidase
MWAFFQNSAELEGFVSCHIRDGAALCAFFAWLEKEVQKGSVTEISAAKKLLEFRAQMRRFVGPSFETISSVGESVLCTCRKFSKTI